MATTHTFGTVGTADRLIRAAIGVTALGFALACPYAARLGIDVQWGSGVIGAALLLSAVAGYCPLYRVLRIAT